METASHIDSRWSACLRLIHNNIAKQLYDTWFAPITFSQFDEERRELTLCVPSPFFVEYIEAHFVRLLRMVLVHIYGEGVRLSYTVTTDATHHLTQTVEATDHSTAVGQHLRSGGANEAPQPLQELDSQLKAEYTFDNFVEGLSNKLPRTVGQAIAADPKQTAFNPFFIYGPSGSGKTHLVNAIGTRIKELHPQKRVLYVAAHLFQVQYTDAVRQNKVNDFIAFYQSIDVLIIDDIQEFATLQKTQMAFFHIFNHLHLNGRQLILTSDRPPVALQGMEERLLTRFKWGLLAELERADLELRRDILRHKIRHNGLLIPENVIDYIAIHVDQSIRDLEGVVNSLMVYSMVWKHPIDVELAQRVIERSVGSPQARAQRALTVDTILEQTCQFFDIDRDEVLSQSRKAAVVQARQVAMYLTQKLTNLSTAKIGVAIGRRNHATVVHSCQNVSRRMTEDADFNDRVSQLQQMLRA